MADNALLQALMGGQTSSAGQLASARYLPSESAWGIGANAVGQVAPLLNNPYASTGSNLGITIGSALFAGLLSGMAKNEANDSNANMFKLAGGAYNVPAADRASIVEQEPRLAPFVAALNQQERDTAIEQANKKADKLLNYDPAVIAGEVKLQGGVEAAKEAARNQSGIPGIPKDLQDNAQKEIKSLSDRDKAKEFANSQFEQAKGIDSVSALVPGSTAANEMTGIANSLATQIQRFLGREMSAVERENFLLLLPDWNDSKGQIESKQKRFNDMLDAFAGGTPTLDSASSPAPQQQESPPAPPAGYELTGKRDANGNYGIRKVL